MKSIFEALKQNCLMKFPLQTNVHDAPEVNLWSRWSNVCIYDWWWTMFCNL